MRQPSSASAVGALSIWRHYRRTGDLRQRDRLVFMFIPMVRHIVYRKISELPSHCEADDLLSCGVEALIRSIERYEPDKGATIEVFAWTRIHGAVLDELRSRDWAPRSLRRDERRIGRARDAFVVANERRPTNDELAAEAGMTPSQLEDRLHQVSLAEVGSLNTLVSTDESAAIEQIDTLESRDALCDPSASAERREARLRFREAFATLTRQEREIAVRLYVDGWTLREIGESMNVSESRVCQIHRQLRERLYEQLAGERQLFAELD